jgi:hypothetical protein
MSLNLGPKTPTISTKILEHLELALEVRNKESEKIALIQWNHHIYLSHRKRMNN